MSRIGKKPIPIPGGVKVAIAGKTVAVEGPKGKLKREFSDSVDIVVEADKILVNRGNGSKESDALQGLTRTLVSNMVEGVTKGFEKVLEINGVGYRVNLAGSDLKFNLGFSHEVVYHLPQGVTATVEGMSITVSGIDRQQVGQVAAEIRALKKPEPYKGKGIKYADERIIRKSGKSGKD